MEICHNAEIITINTISKSTYKHNKTKNEQHNIALRGTKVINF